uniref:Uncharacterized protein n=1 Tax=Oryza brachyantha TaxID=4533 RepID=J3MFU7_ORYBR
MTDPAEKGADPFSLSASASSRGAAPHEHRAAKDLASLLEAYRRDRRALLGFILSTVGGRAVDLSRVDLDAVSADYALDCVASGEPLSSLD